MIRNHGKCVALFAAGCLASAAWAQAPDQPREKPKQGEMRQIDESKAADKGMKVAVLRLIKFGALENTTVKNHEGKDIGHIDEVMVDPQTGNVRYAALSFGGLLELGDKKFAIPLEAMDIQSEDRIVFNVTKEKLEEKEGFDKDNWPSHADSRWAGHRAGQQGTGQQAGKPSGTQQGSMSPKKSSKLIGMEVKNRQDEQLGKISELYLDPDRSRVVYACMSHGGILGIGDKHFAVPWQSFETNKQDVLVLDIPRSQLENAPYAAAAERDTWYDPDWVVSVYQYYKVEPYWVTAARQDAPRERRMDPARDPDQQPDRDQQTDRDQQPDRDE